MLFTRRSFLKSCSANMETNPMGHQLLACVCILLAGLIGFSTGNYPLLDVDTNMRIVLVPYDTPVGTTIYRLKASDSDNNFPLAFEVLGSVGKSLLTLEFLGCSVTESLCQADVLLSKPLDEGRTYEFKLRVRDTTGDYTQVPAVITATTGSFYSHSVLGTKILHVPEDTLVGAQLEKFVVLKNDFNARVVTLEMREKDERIELKQRLLSNNRTEGILLLKKPLDFETEPWFTFRLLAMNAYTNTNVDTRNVLISEVIVAVQDVQDTPPEFQILPTFVEIPKSIQKGDLITKVVAVDGDKQNKRLIRYGLLTDSNPFVSFFELDPMSGEIFLKRELSQLSTMARPNEPIRMTIIAEEIISENEITRFSRSLQTLEDKSLTKAIITFWLGPGVAVGPPRFSTEQYVADIAEDSVIGATLHFALEPRIWYDNFEETVTLTFASSNSNGRVNDSSIPFEIIPRVGKGNFSFEVRLLDPRLVDYETIQQIKLKFKDLTPKLLQILAATSSGMVTSADFTCHIRDSNDNSPVFSQKEYRVELPESAPIGTRVVQVHAVDRDSGNNGRVVYTSLVGSEAFRIDAVTGEITVDKSDLLDREVEPEIRLYVEAKDGGYTDASGSIDNGFTSVRNIASATVVVKLVDVNDNAPRFSEKYYQVILTPDMTALKYPVRVTADDDDGDGPNSLVRYQLTPDSPRQFSIDQVSGELKLRVPFKPDIQNQDGLYLGSLKVRAYDSGSPQLSSETTVQIFSKEVLSRQIQFVLPSKPDMIESNRKRIEDMLSSITGGSASIKDVRLLHPSRSQSHTQIQPSQQSAQPKTLTDNPSSEDSDLRQQTPQQQIAPARSIPNDKSLVTAEVTYPISSAPVVDLDAFQRTYMTTSGLTSGTTTGTSHSGNRTNVTDRQIELFRAENQMLFWLLIAFIILLLILFALFLCCIFCPCCYLYTYCKRYDKRREVVQDIEVDKVQSARRNRKTYPARIEEEGGEYDIQNQTGYRREAWSGNDNGRLRRAPGGTLRRFPTQNLQQGGRPTNNMGRAEGDVSLQDWEFNEHGSQVRGDPRAEEIGPRWQQNNRRQGGYPPAGNQQIDPLVTDGFVSRRPVQQNPEGDCSSEPGNNTYLMQRLNHLPPGARPYHKFYPPPRSTAHSLPPTEAQIRAQTRPTRFYRTEAGEVLQLDDYEGDEGKEMLMRRFINEQEPQNELNQQSAAQVEHHYVSQAQDHGPNFEKRRVRTPAAIVPPRRTTNEPALPSNATHQQSLTMKGGFVTEKSSKDVIAGNNTGSVAERPKAAVVSRRSREALEIREDGDAEFGIIDDDAHKSKSPTPVSREQPSGAPGTSKPGDKGKKDELQVDEGYSRRRREKEKESRRDKS
ncbi:unnamed protein product, partial [Allacma fusca]